MQEPKPPSRRLQRVSELLRREMSEIIRRDLPIEQAGLITINDVVVAPDLRTATAFVGFVGTPAQRRAAPERLESRAAHFQKILGSHLRLKWTPVIRFILDDSVERGNRVLAVITELEQQSPQPTPPPTGKAS